MAIMWRGVGSLAVRCVGVGVVCVGWPDVYWVRVAGCWDRVGVWGRNALVGREVRRVRRRRDSRGAAIRGGGSVRDVILIGLYILCRGWFGCSVIASGPDFWEFSWTWGFRLTEYYSKQNFTLIA